MSEFLSGAMMAGFAVAGMFFVRYYRESGDRLFAMFAAAFFVLSVNRWAIALTQVNEEVHTVFYVVRLFAYVLILAAILDKNRSTAKVPPSSRAPQATTTATKHPASDLVS